MLAECISESRLSGEERPARFLGQFLVARGLVTATEVQEAAALCDSMNKRMGQLAAAQGFMTTEQATQVNRVQRVEDARFGEIARRMGLLTTEQCDALFKLQRKRRLRIGDALLQLGYVERPTLEAAFQDFAEQEQDIRRRSRTPIMSLEQGPVGYLREHVLTLMLRVAQIQAKLDPGLGWPEKIDFDFRVTIEIDTDESVVFGLCADRELATAVTCNMLGVEAEDCDAELNQDALNEFSNLLAGHTQRQISAGADTRLGLPQPGILPDTGFMFPLASPSGEGALIIQL